MPPPSRVISLHKPKANGYQRGVGLGKFFSRQIEPEEKYLVVQFNSASGVIRLRPSVRPAQGSVRLLHNRGAYGIINTDHRAFSEKEFPTGRYVARRVRGWIVARLSEPHIAASAEPVPNGASPARVPPHGRVDAVRSPRDLQAFAVEVVEARGERTAGAVLDHGDDAR